MLAVVNVDVVVVVALLVDEHCARALGAKTLDGEDGVLELQSVRRRDRARSRARASRRSGGVLSSRNAYR